MDPSEKKRIDQAWEEVNDWITQFTGAPTITLLMEVPAEAVLPGLRMLEQQTENLRITAIPADLPDVPRFISLETVDDYLNQLLEDKIAELSVNFGVRAEEFDLDVHMILYWISSEKLALELVWWSDQVFSEETDDYAQFTALMAYFIELQKLFSSSALFLSPESGVSPGQKKEAWVAV